MAGSRSPLPHRRRWLGRLSVLAAALAVVAGGVLWQLAGPSSLADVGDAVERLRPVTSAVRLGLIALLALAWPRLVEAAERLGRLDGAGKAALLSLRWRLVGWLLVLELLLGQGLLGRFLAAFGAGPA